MGKSSKMYKKRRWLTKFVTGICGVGTILQLWQHQQHNSCPRCGESNESTQHVLTCKNEAATSTWDNAVDNLETWMKDNDGEPHMIHIICDSLRSWRNGERLPIPSTAIPQIVMEAMIDQDNIGWFNFTNGFLARKWRIIQTAYFKDIRTQRSPDLWMAKCQLRIWEIAWMMWQHRNDFLHNDGKTIHFQEVSAINRSIRIEFTRAGNGLPAIYQHLFQINIDDLLASSTSMKQEWLTSVWAARDHFTPNNGGIRDEIAEAFYTRWINKFK
jgi:hypothetical protein